ncbi:hypothetical protein OWR29_30845 [Actinoplanes sp. Pm04-4]|uniref:Uncharacterized protein n=1 Tax=Paractinoplanes pyxinae TaxID=2997416 RepID=A0ABT4B7C9_9ACTN|nr:hypothetical protein [Actinoplanes pyxinae]MCY1142418.1 hypothetical protein [Actinoplanes pyxinae]
MTSLRTRLDPQRHEDIRRTLITAASPPPPRRRRTLIAVAAAVVATAGVALSVYPAPPPEHAPWTAIPQAAPPLTAPRKDIDQWSSKCSDLGVGGVGIEGVPSRPEAAAKREVLVDRRGSFTYCVDVSLGSGTATDPLIALSGVKPDADDGLNGSWATVRDKPFTRPKPTEVLVLGGDLEEPPAGNPGLQPLQLYGLSGSAVTGVDVVLTNGLRITASLGHGIWGAWWPSDKGDPVGSKLELHTAAGTTTIDPRAHRLSTG